MSPNDRTQIPPDEEEREDAPPAVTDLLAAQEALSEDHRSGFVAVIGRPNVGKSTLLNRLLGQKIAITSDKPQTTRDQILGIRTDAETQYIFLDTPGIHRPLNRLGKHMVQVAEETIANDADAILWLVDVNVPPTDEDQMIVERLQALNDEFPLPPVLLGFNQIDGWRGSAEALQERQAAYTALLDWLLTDPETQDDLPTLAFSALSGEGLERVLDAIRSHLPPGPRYYPEEQVTDLNVRFLVAELIREQALHHLRQEVPHSIAVAVTEFEEREGDVIYIAATIYVERQSQKGIVLGRKGTMIKEIGQSARPQIEEMVGAQVYLDLWVKVWEKWRRREEMLQRLGYEIR